MTPSLPPGFHVDVERSGGETRATLFGELDIAEVPKLEAELAHQGDATRLVLDLRQLVFLDSVGLRALLTIHTECVRDARELEIITAPGPVHRLFERTGLDSRLPLVDGTDGDDRG